MSAATKAPAKRRGALTETREEFLVRVGAYEPFPPEQWVRIKAIIEAPLPPAASPSTGEADRG